MGLVEVRTEHVCQRFKAPFFLKKNEVIFSESLLFELRQEG